MHCMDALHCMEAFRPVTTGQANQAINCLGPQGGYGPPDNNFEITVQLVRGNVKM